MFAGFGGFCRPGDVELVGQGIVDGVDVGIGEEFFVGAVCLGDIECGGGFSGLVEVAGGDGIDGGEAAELHGGQNFLQADVGGAQDSPAKLLGHAQNSRPDLPRTPTGCGGSAPIPWPCDRLEGWGHRFGSQIARGRTYGPGIVLPELESNS